MKLCQFQPTGTWSLPAILEYLNTPTTDLEKVTKILMRIKGSTFKRSNPYNLEHPLQGNRYVGLRAVDTSLWST